MAKFISVIAIVLGVYVFFRVSAWLDSIAWSMLATGFVLDLVRVRKPEEWESAPQPQKQEKYGLGQAFLDAYIEEKVIEEAVINAHRKMDQ